MLTLSRQNIIYKLKNVLYIYNKLSKILHSNKDQKSHKS